MFGRNMFYRFYMYFLVTLYDMVLAVLGFWWAFQFL